MVLRLHQLARHLLIVRKQQTSQLRDISVDLLKLLSDLLRIDHMQCLL